MRSLGARGAAPVGWGDPDRIRSFYDAPRHPSGAWNARWNEGPAGGARPVRDWLAQLSDGCCAYCGERLAEAWPVDHYLPTSAFPRLAFCTDNLLPCCVPCNVVRKRDYRPPGIAPDSFADPALAASDADPYRPVNVLPRVTERLVEPTVDDPAAHLEFVPELHTYRSKTPVGEATRQTFFDERSDADRLAKIGELVRVLVLHGDPEESFEGLISLIGRRHHVLAYRAFWQAFAPALPGPGPG